MSRRRTLWAAGAATAVATAVAAGKVLARRERRTSDPADAERFDELPPEEIAPVVSEDGTLLHVRAVGARPARVSP